MAKKRGNNIFEVEKSITAEIEEVLAEYRSVAAELSSASISVYNDKLKSLRAELQGSLCEGAKACPNCGRLPIAIHQPAYYEIGCTSATCRDHHSKAQTPQDAVNAWNAENYFKRTG